MAFFVFWHNLFSPFDVGSFLVLSSFLARWQPLVAPLHLRHQYWPPDEFLLRQFWLFLLNLFLRKNYLMHTPFFAGF